ncbi:MAG: hypothetical protein ABIH21_01815 [Patescibacteria group bacterium]
MKRVSYKIILLAFALVLLVNNDVQALTISPYMIDVELERGESFTDTVLLTNESDKAQIYFPSVQDFVAKGETGTPHFVGVSSVRSLVDWVKFDQERFEIDSGQTMKASFVVSVPKSTDAGGYFGGLLFSSADPNVSEGVGVVGATGPLLILKIKGDLIEQGELIGFDIDRGRSSNRHLSLVFETRFKNTGNVHLQPVGVIKVKNVFGTTVANIPFNPNASKVLPDSTREFETVWHKGMDAGDVSELKKEISQFAIGPYSATLITNYGQTGVAVSDTVHFWIIPWLLIAMSLSFVLVAVVLVGQYKKLLKKSYAK